MNPTAPVYLRHPIVLVLTLACLALSGIAGPAVARRVAVIADIAWLYLGNSAG